MPNWESKVARKLADDRQLAEVVDRFHWSRAFAEPVQTPPWESAEHNNRQAVANPWRNQRRYLPGEIERLFAALDARAAAVAPIVDAITAFRKAKRVYEDAQDALTRTCTSLRVRPQLAVVPLDGVFADNVPPARLYELMGESEAQVLGTSRDVLEQAAIECQREVEAFDAMIGSEPQRGLNGLPIRT